MTLYELLKFLHVFMAITWVGSGILLTILAFRAQRSNEPGELARRAADAEWVGTKILAPVSGVVLLLGIGMVLEGDIGFTTTWILIALVGWAISAGTGAMFLGPESGRLKALIDAKGPDDVQVKARIERLLLVARIDLLLLIFVVFDMVVKPGT
jgi:uncharacterized membrane protein